MNTGPQSWHSSGGRGEDSGSETAELPLLRQGITPTGPIRPAVALPLPTTVLWRWRYEAAAVGGTPLFWWGSIHAVGGLTGLSFVTSLLALVALLPPLRRWAFAVLWTIVTPHRIRVACAEAGVVSRSGKLPTVMFTRRKSYGERVYLWCPEGVSAVDFAAAQSVFVTACWAREINVFETRAQYSRVVAVEVVRHDVPVADVEDVGVPALWARFERHAGRFEGFGPRH